MSLESLVNQADKILTLGEALHTKRRDLKGRNIVVAFSFVDAINVQGDIFPYLAKVTKTDGGESYFHVVNDKDDGHHLMYLHPEDHVGRKVIPHAFQIMRFLPDGQVIRQGDEYQSCSGVSDDCNFNPHHWEPVLSSIGMSAYNNVFFRSLRYKSPHFSTSETRKNYQLHLLPSVIANKIDEKKEPVFICGGAIMKSAHADYLWQMIPKQN